MAPIRIAVALLLLTGCSAEEFSGTVVEKHYSAAETHTGIASNGQMVVTNTPAKRIVVVKVGEDFIEAKAEQNRFYGLKVGETVSGRSFTGMRFIPLGSEVY